MFESINLAILIGAGLVATSALTSIISQRIGAPLLLIFLGIGLLAGEDGLLGIQFDSGTTAYFIGSLALAIILFDSGFATPMKSYRQAAAPALTLATLGVILTTAFVGAGAHFLFSLPWIESLMLGAIIASTDAAAVFFLLRVGGITLRDRVKSTLEIESGANDPMAIFLTATLVELAANTNGMTAGLTGELLVGFIHQIGLGLLFGAIGGVIIALLLNRLRQFDAGLYPIVGIAVSLVVFATSGLLGGSGFLSAYVAGLVSGNMNLRFASRIRRFQVGTTWLAQIGMFLTLGLLATPSEFGPIILPAVVLAALLIFVARPAAIWICLLPFGFNWREILFISWVGLRGAVSIMLAILPTIGGIPSASAFFNVIFVMVLASLLAQGWTIALAARFLKLIIPPDPGMLDRIELELPGNSELELVGYRIHPDSAIGHGERAPRWARPVLILRDGRTFSIHNAGPLQPHDQVYLFAAPSQVGLLDKVYTRPGDQNDPQIFGDFVLNPDATLGEVAAEYDVSIGSAQPETRLDDLLMREFHNQPAIGDRLSFGPMELVVRNIDDEGAITEIGLLVEPAREGRMARFTRYFTRK